MAPEAANGGAMQTGEISDSKRGTCMNALGTGMGATEARASARDFGGSAVAPTKEEDATVNVKGTATTRRGTQGSLGFTEGSVGGRLRSEAESPTTSQFVSITVDASASFVSTGRDFTLSVDQSATGRAELSTARRFESTCDRPDGALACRPNPLTVGGGEEKSGGVDDRSWVEAPECNGW